LHELSVAGGIFQAVLDALKSMEGVRGLKTVRVEVGELTFLNPQQLKFAWEVLSEQNELTRGSVMEIERISPRGQCERCGWEGSLQTEEDPTYHFITPIFSCPSCGGDITIVRGLETKVKNIVVDIEEEEDAE